MSGGVVGPIGMTGSVSIAAIGAAVAIGATAKAAADITKMGSIAAYEQMKLAAACTAAVSNAKEQRKQAVTSYYARSRAAQRRLDNFVNEEISRLHLKLNRLGRSVDLGRLGDNNNAILLSLISLDQKYSSGNDISGLRVPSEIYHSIAAQIDPLFTYIPRSDAIFDELTKLKKRATSIAEKTDMSAIDKSKELIMVERQLASSMDAYRSCARKYEYYFAQFTSLLFANEKLSEACNVDKLHMEYDPEKVATQIEQLSNANAELRRNIRERIKTDDAFVDANKELARRVFASIQESGFNRLKVAQMAYGTTALFAYRDSLLSVTVSREGILSMDLVEKNGERKEQIKADEHVFCESDLSKINRAFERNGLTMKADRICDLTAESMLCEGDLDYVSLENDRWDEDFLLAMYADSNGESQ